jgi:hypothetical protein
MVQAILQKHPGTGTNAGGNRGKPGFGTNAGGNAEG